MAPAEGVSGFFWKRLFSALGIAPIGVYVVLHLYGNSHSLQGQASYDAYLARSRDLPYYSVLVWLFVYLPILVHGIYGVVIVLRGRVEARRYTWLRNYKYLLQRLSGLGLLLFIPAHIYKTRIEPPMQGKVISFHHMVEGLHEPLTLGVYLLAVTGVAFHLANGIWDFCYTWGITVGPRAQRSVEILSIFLFVVLLLMGLNALRGFFL